MSILMIAGVVASVLVVFVLFVFVLVMVNKNPDVGKKIEKIEAMLENKKEEG